ncbi:MAG TPA: hypothetical protein VFQ88_07785 [Nevskiaceae bacterium]|nr:hypothetical protein [Nevskiaceae bacterium]
MRKFCPGFVLALASACFAVAGWHVPLGVDARFVPWLCVCGALLAMTGGAAYVLTTDR